MSQAEDKEGGKEKYQSNSLPWSRIWNEFNEELNAIVAPYQGLLNGGSLIDRSYEAPSRVLYRPQQIVFLPLQLRQLFRLQAQGQEWTTDEDSPKEEEYEEEEYERRKP